MSVYIKQQTTMDSEDPLLSTNRQKNSCCQLIKILLLPNTSRTNSHKYTHPITYYDPVLSRALKQRNLDVSIATEIEQLSKLAKKFDLPNIALSGTPQILNKVVRFKLSGGESYAFFVPVFEIVAQSYFYVVQLRRKSGGGELASDLSITISIDFKNMVFI